MSHWNYRVMESQEENVLDAKPETSFTIIETYYTAEGTIWGYAVVSAPWGETLADLKQDLDAMIHAFTSPVLKKDELPK